MPPRSLTAALAPRSGDIKCHSFPACNGSEKLSVGMQDAAASQAAAEAVLEEVKAAWEEREAEDADLRSRLQAREDQVPDLLLSSTKHVGFERGDGV